MTGTVWAVYLLCIAVITFRGCCELYKARKAKTNNTIQELLDMTQLLPPGYEVNVKFIKDGVVVDCVLPDEVVGGKLLGLVELPDKLTSAENIRYSFCEFVHRAQGHSHIKDDNKVKEVTS